MSTQPDSILVTKFRHDIRFETFDLEALFAVEPRFDLEWQITFSTWIFHSTFISNFRLGLRRRTRFEVSAVRSYRRFTPKFSRHTNRPEPSRIDFTGSFTRLDFRFAVNTVTESRAKREILASLYNPNRYDRRSNPFRSLQIDDILISPNRRQTNNGRSPRVSVSIGGPATTRRTRR